MPGEADSSRVATPRPAVPGAAASVTHRPPDAPRTAMRAVSATIWAGSRTIGRMSRAGGTVPRPRPPSLSELLVASRARRAATAAAAPAAAVTAPTVISVTETAGTSAR
ncbi:hypothetical protein [Actinomadura madurae]|uniref:hypothetical protein n=1 Tax=Actinomadura madurae TaxID=1993 RepID=UPI0020D22897|nr:hypothetical protein [Actinomadura madurae]MCQ0011519.1 hypothetical protein [Actinomadura madurae]